MSYVAITADHAKLRKVRKRLRLKGYTAYLPAIVSKRIIPKGPRVSRKRRIVPLMNYILVEVPNLHVLDLWIYDVMQIKDVRGYVKIRDAAALITDDSITSLKNAVADIVSEVEESRRRANIRRGGKYAIKSGSLAGKSGSVAWIRGKRVGLEAKLFGSMRVVEVTAENLEAA